MKTSLLALAATTLAGLAAVTLPSPAQDKAEPKPEALPEYPKLDPKNTVTPLDKEKVIHGEFAPAGDKKKLVRVGVVTEVCLREGPLEILLCKKGTKEHEAIVKVDADAKLIHLALLAAGASDKGTPTRFVDPKTEEPKYTAATGTKINVTVHYNRGGKTFTHPAQEWIWDTKKKAAFAHNWVFTGSVEIKDPDNPNRPPFYGANSGDVISISNFPYSMLEVPVEISKDDAQLTYEAKTDKIPPLMSKVWLILEPVVDKK